MSHAIEIMTELEKVFDEKKAKILTNAILKREEQGNLVTKDYLHSEMNGLKAEFYKETSSMKDDLRKGMSQGFIDVYKAINGLQKSITDVQKSITRMTIYFISAIGTIAVIFKVFDIVFAK